MPAIRNLKSLTADGPTEEMTFTCSSMEWTYTDCDAAGKPTNEIRTQWPTRTDK